MAIIISNNKLPAQFPLANTIHPEIYIQRSSFLVNLLKHQKFDLKSPCKGHSDIFY